MKNRKPAPLGPGFGNENTQKAVLDYINQVDELNRYGLSPAINPNKIDQEKIAGSVLLNYVKPQKTLQDYIVGFSKDHGIDPNSFKVQEANFVDPRTVGAQSRGNIYLRQDLMGTDPYSVWNAFHEFQHEKEMQKGEDKNKKTGHLPNIKEKYHHGLYEDPIQDVWPYLRRRIERKELGFDNAPQDVQILNKP